MQTENDEKVKSSSRNLKENGQSSGNKAERKKAARSPSQSKADDFKRKYFEFYDDIKISDRQDW